MFAFNRRDCKGPGAPGQALEPRSTSRGANGSQARWCPPAQTAGPLEPRRTPRPLPEAPSQGPRATQWGGKHSLILIYRAAAISQAHFRAVRMGGGSSQCPRLWHRGGCPKRRNRESPKKYRKGGRGVGVGSLPCERWGGDSPDGRGSEAEMSLRPLLAGRLTGASLWTSVSLIRTMTPVVSEISIQPAPSSPKTSFHRLLFFFFCRVLHFS